MDLRGSVKATQPVKYEQNNVTSEPVHKTDRTHWESGFHILKIHCESASISLGACFISYLLTVDRVDGFYRLLTQ